MSAAADGRTADLHVAIVLVVGAAIGMAYARWFDRRHPELTFQQLCLADCKCAHSWLDHDPENDACSRRSCGCARYRPARVVSRQAPSRARHPSRSRATPRGVSTGRTVPRASRPERAGPGADERFDVFPADD